MDAQVVPDPLFLFPFWSQVSKADDPVFFILYGFCQEAGRKATKVDIFARGIVSGFSLSDISALAVRKQDNQKNHHSLHFYPQRILLPDINNLQCFCLFFFLHIYN